MSDGHAVGVGEAVAVPSTTAAPEKKRRRARGKGSLFKHGQHWWIAVSFRGQRIRENTNQTDKRKAQEYLDAKIATLMQAKVKGVGVVTSELRRVTVRERIDVLLLDFDLRKVRSVASSRAHLGLPPKPKSPGETPASPTRIVKAFGTWRVADLSEEAIDQYIKTRQDAGARPATINRETQLLGQAVQPFLAKLGLPALKIRRLSEADNVRQGFFERAEFERVLAALPEDLRDLARFGYFAGWRRGEIFSLRWSDVDREGGVIRLRPEHSKNGRGRTLVLDGDDLPALVERRWAARVVPDPNGTTKVSPFVFHRDGAPIVDFRKAWATACEKAGVPGRLFHDLRRTAVRNMVRAGVRESVAMKVSGHRTRSTFDRYDIGSEADLRDAARRTSAYVSRLPVEATVVPTPAKAQAAVR
jgi:integrase